MKPKLANNKTAAKSGAVPAESISPYALAHLAVPLIAAGASDDDALSRAYALLRRAGPFLEKAASEEYSAQRAKTMNMNLESLSALLNVSDRRQVRKWTLAAHGDEAGKVIWKRLLNAEQISLDAWLPIHAARKRAIIKGSSPGPHVEHGNLPKDFGKNFLD